MRGLSVALFTVCLTCASAPAFGEEALARIDSAHRSSASLLDLLERADRQKLYEAPGWLALLHYETRWPLPGSRSPVLTPTFFLSERGNRDPRAELHATLRAFFDPGATMSSGEHPQCAFIARRHWLEQRLELRPGILPRVDCSAFERWRADLDARGLTLIFPEGFMNNPASIFGHTLLRIDVTSQGGAEEILGWAVDFTARTADDPVVVYMARGVAGYYPASFGVRPYYQQLKRYSDWENRDIWEYRLDVDQTQLDFLLMHLWELRGVEFPYYFFTRNCSYELLRLLDVAIPDLDASSRFRGPVIPVDTVRVLAAHPGLIEATRYRPSPETKLRAALRSLSREDRGRVHAIAEGRLDPADPTLRRLPLERRARVLDVAYEQLRYAYLAGNVSEDASRGLSRRILVARSHVALPPTEKDSATAAVPQPMVRPDEGHGSARLTVSTGWRDEEAFMELGVRPAFHDLMDSGGGYPEAMQVRFLDTRLRIYPESGRVRLQELTLFDVGSLSPRSRVFRPWAWSVGTGMRTRRVPDEGDLEDASTWGSHIAAGLASDPGASLLLYGLADVQLDVGPDLEHSVAFGPGARFGVFVGGREARWRGNLFGQVSRFALGDTTTFLRSGAALRLTTTRNTALGLECGVNHSYGETWLDARLQLSLYL
jgi:hypothetical protein